MSTDIETRYKALTARREVLAGNKMKLDAELDARKRALRTAMEDCKKAGWDPDTIADQIKKMKEVLVVKMDVFEADLQTAEDQVRPMMKEIG
jgi:hypothetical protein